MSRTQVSPEVENGRGGDGEGGEETGSGGGSGGRKVAASPATGQVHMVNQQGTGNQEGTDGKFLSNVLHIVVVVVVVVVPFCALLQNGTNLTAAPWHGFAAGSPIPY